jgi:transcriptional regulator with XRE-family HTH domain
VTAKSKGGRPTDYRPEHCARVIELGREGKSRAQIAAALDVSRQTIATWEKTHPGFLDAMTRAHDLALAWWEDQGARGIWAGKAFNATAFGLQMRNRFQHEYGRPDTVVDLNLDEVRASLQGKLARLAPGGAARKVAR